MGQARRNKARLGEWYGRSIVPGHPDYVPPKKTERHAALRSVDRGYDTTKRNDPSTNGVYVADSDGNLQRAETVREEPMHPDVVRTLSKVGGAHEGQMASEESPDEPLPAMRGTFGLGENVTIWPMARMNS